MNRKLMKFSGISALALTLVMWGCDNLSETKLTGPSDESNILIITKDANGYTIAQETDPAVGIVSASIDENGGSLNIGNHVLTVPAGAVSQPTLFTMTKLVDDIKIGLTATRLLPNDVGHAGFNVPVTLSLSYANAAVPNAEALKILWIKPDGSQVVQPSLVDAAGQDVIGTLSHFSDYGVGWPKDPANDP
jgi:hypothetical protein